MRGLAVGRQAVNVRSMGVTVEQPLDAVLFHDVHHRLRVNVHDGHGFAAVGGFAARAHLRRDTIANKQRQSQEQRLDPGVWTLARNAR